MATRRDLLEAQSFDRRRLVAAFLSGGRPVEPGHPGRCLAWGLVVSGLVILGALAVDAVSEHLPDGWRVDLWSDSETHALAGWVDGGGHASKTGLPP